jgi:hypothetical protein
MGLAGARACYHKDRAFNRVYGLFLGRVELLVSFLES